MKAVSDWLYNNKLTLNASKTKVMTFGSSRAMSNRVPLNIKLDDFTLTNVSVFKYLGMWFDPCLKWDEHVDKITAKLSQKLGILKRLSWCLDQYTRNTLYNAIILPHIDYCSAVWTTASNRLVDRVQIMQNRAARLVLGCGVRDMHVADIYKELKWLNVRQRASYFRNTLMYKCVHGLAPDYLITNTNLQRNCHSYCTRSSYSNDISQDFVRTENGRRSFKFSGGRSWNSLPPNLKSLPDCNNFKRKLKMYTFCTDL